MSTLITGYLAYYILATVGITLGYHRYFAHSQKKTSNIWESIMLLCGVICACRSPIMWCGVHRMHHAYSDTKQDPHSPEYLNWYEIIFSILKVKYVPKKFIIDLLKNPRVMFFHKYRYIIWSIVAGISLFAGVFAQFLIIQIFSYFGFGLINYFGHNNNQPVNNKWINFIAPFEGNHVDHHNAQHNR